MMTSWIRPKCLWGLVFLLFVAFLLGADEKSDQVDRLFAEWDTTTSPGAALAIIKDGRIIYERGYGMAKIEDDLIMTPSKIFDIASVSKQFTATCIALLVKQEKISLDDDVRKYIPELPRYQKPITIKHLIYHTSGLRDYTELLELAGYRPGIDSSNAADALELISSQKNLNHLPGEKYSYTNTGYFLLGQIAERVSGKSLNEFAREHIFEPLGMSHTIYQDDHTKIIKNRASGYSRQNGGYRFDLSNWDQTGDGNLYTSIEDLCLWDQAFYSNALGKDVMDMLHQVGTLNNGAKLDYAFGLEINDYKGLKMVKHTGSWAGFRAAIIRFPKQKFSVICLANLSSISPLSLSLKIADIYLSAALKEPPREEAKEAALVRLSQEELEEKSGNYEDDRFHGWVSLTVKAGRLTMKGMGYEERPLRPLSKTLFQVEDRPGITLEFLPTAQGRPKQAILNDREYEETYALIKAAPIVPLRLEELKEFAGNYISEELLGVTYRLQAENGGLIIKFRSIPLTPFKSMAPDKFCNGDISLEFIRKKEKRIAAFKLSSDSAADIEFTRK